MFVQNSMRKLRLTSIGSFYRFLIMFILVVVGPFVLIVIGGYDPKVLGQAGMGWAFLSFGLLLLVCIGGGFLLFRRKSEAGKISLSQPEVPLMESDINAKTDR